MATAGTPLQDRHPGTQHLMALLEVNSRLTGVAREVSSRFENLASGLLSVLSDGQELTETLRKLWEAKNNAVMQSILDAKARG